MKYEVVWLPSAELGLDRIWFTSHHRAAIIRAAYEIELRLGLDPANQGESRPFDRRVMFAKPLGVLYRTLESECLVQVVYVWDFT